MIIDSHSHLGSCRVFDLDTSEQELLSTMANNGITTNIVQPYPGAPNVREVHNRIGKLAEENPGKIFGLASLNPHMNEDEYNEEVERVVKDLGFVAVKIHTIGHAVNPLGRSADKVFKAAKKLGIPVMVHTGPGVPFSLPSLTLPRAQQFPDVNIILAHSGNGMVVSADVFPTALSAKNIYLETSWSGVWEKEAFVKTFGADRVMFGSDLTMNCSTELHQFQSLKLTEEERDKCLFTTANNLFKLRI